MIMQTTERMSIPIKDIFGSVGQIDPDGTRELLEWFISRGKDGKGVAVIHNLEDDSLSLCPDFRARVMVWKPKSGERDPYKLRKLPDENKFRAYLAGYAFFQTEQGVIYTQEEWVSFLEANNPRSV